MQVTQSLSFAGSVLPARMGEFFNMLCHIFCTIIMEAAFIIAEIVYYRMKIKVLCEQTREANKRIKMFFALCLILFGFGNIVADFHVLFRVRGN